MNRFFAIPAVLVLGVAMVSAAPGKQAYPLRDSVPFTVREGLPNFLKKANTTGASIRIGYLGGSITAQSGWRPKTLSWFQKTYPKATFTEINAAIGGTGSDLGVYRLEQDVLQHKPDLLFVEFAVNDGGAQSDRIHKAMEGIVRQTWKANPETDICFVYTLTQGMLKDLQKGKYPNAASAMEVLADFYGIPSIHMGYHVSRLEQTGTVLFKHPKPRTPEEREAVKGKILFSKDGVHPYAGSGHQLYLEAVVAGMKAMRTVGKVGAHVLAAPMRADNWENAKLIPFGQATLSAGWQEVTDTLDDERAKGLAKRFRSRLPRMWVARKPGEIVTFKFKGSDLRIYDLVGPDCGQVIVTVDGKPAGLRRRFDAYCTYYRLQTMAIASGLDPESVHTVKLVLHAGKFDKAAILARRKQNAKLLEKPLDPKKFDGGAWYIGSIMLMGELVP